LILASAAAESLATVEGDPDREAVESDLTDALHAALSPITIGALRAIDEPTSESLSRIADAGIRVQMARRFHNDAVIDVRRVRRKTVVRLFRLAGHAELPATIEFDDELPPSLRG
jgi:hypothetical protein